MRSRWLPIAALALLGTGWVALAQDAAPTNLDWGTDLEAARAVAAEKSRPLMIVFR